MSLSSVTRILPKRQMSWLVGKIAQIPLPKMLRAPVLSLFSYIVGIDLSEVELPLPEYRSVGEFFSRRLRVGARPIDPALLTCPVDGTLRETGVCSSALTFTVKGAPYTLEELLGSRSFAALCEGAHWWNIYLSPRDYHRVHAPVDGILEEMILIPGALWPVNDWSLANIPKLFSKNERLVFVFKQENRTTILVMVGATNVGSIRLPWEPSFSTSRLNFGSKALRRFPTNRQFSRGDELAYFALGSSVVLFSNCHSTHQEFLTLVESGSQVRLGLPLMTGNRR